MIALLLSQVNFFSQVDFLPGPPELAIRRHIGVTLPRYSHEAAAIPTPIPWEAGYGHEVEITDYH